MKKLLCRSLITAGLFEEAASQQGQLPTGQAVWKEVRGRMAAASGARKALVDECPISCIGALLAMLLQQVRYHHMHSTPQVYCNIGILHLAVTCLSDCLHSLTQDSHQSSVYPPLNSDVALHVSSTPSDV